MHTEPMVSQSLPHDPLIGVRTKIARAKRHTKELDRELRAFRERRPYHLFAEDDPETGDQLLRFRLAETHTGVLGRHRRRRDPQSALFARSVDQPAGHRQRQHPDRQDALSNGLHGQGIRKLDGASPRAIRLIKALKPYKGGNHALWASPCTRHPRQTRPAHSDHRGACHDGRDP